MQTATRVEPERTSTRPWVWWGYLVVLAAVFGASAALTAPLSVDLRVTLGGWALIAVYAVYGAFLTRHDLRTRRLPNALTLPLATVLTGIVLGLGASTGHWTQAIAAMIGGAGFMVVLSLVGFAGQVGFGDVKLALSVGIVTGWFGMFLPVWAVVLAYVLALPHAITAVVMRSRGRDITDLPFGPYLIAAGAIVAVTAAIAG